MDRWIEEKGEMLACYLLFTACLLAPCRLDRSIAQLIDGVGCVHCPLSPSLPPIWRFSARTTEARAYEYIECSGVPFLSVHRERLLEYTYTHTYTLFSVQSSFDIRPRGMCVRYPERPRLRDKPGRADRFPSDFATFPLFVAECKWD